MILAGDKAGHPWHGLWQSSDNKITTPAAVEILLSGDSPSGEMHPDDVHMPPGDAIIVAIPDQPAVTTTPAEAALGETWLNYGILSGPLHRIAGKNLGYNKWLYVADDKSVWLASMAYYIDSGSIAITFSRFGDFRIGAAADTVTKTASHGSGISGADYWMIDDISPTGGELLLTSFNRPADARLDVLNGGIRDCRGGAKVTISGTPPDVTLSASIIVPSTEISDVDVSGSQTNHVVWYRVGDPENAPGIISEFSDAGSIEWDFINEEEPIPDPPEQGEGAPWSISNFYESFSRFETEKTFIGLAFSSSGSAEAMWAQITASVSFSCTTSWSVGYYPPDPDLSSEFVLTQTSSYTADFSHKFVLGESELLELEGNMQVAGSLDPSGWGQDDNVITYDYSWGFAGVDYSKSTTGYGGHQLVPAGLAWHRVGGLGMSVLLNDLSELTATHFDYFVPLRYGNSLFGVVRVGSEVSPPDVDGVEYLDVFSPSGSSDDSASGTNLGQHFATRHPVTGIISRSATPLCVV